MSIVVIGTPELRLRLKELGDRAEKELGGALYREGEKIMATSKRDYVPVDTGMLRSTGHVRLPQKGPVVYFGYGGPASKYARVQHDGMYHHKIGERKYLERPLMIAIPGMGDRIAKSLATTLIAPAVKKSRRSK